MTDYKLIYKLNKTIHWKYFWLKAKTDLQAIQEAGDWANKMNVETYKLEKVTTERLI